MSKLKGKLEFSVLSAAHSDPRTKKVQKMKKKRTVLELKKRRKRELRGRMAQKVKEGGQLQKTKKEDEEKEGTRRKDS